MKNAIRFHLCLWAVMGLFWVGGTTAATGQVQVLEAKEEAEEAFRLLNAIRANPAKYSQEIGVNLRAYAARPALKWNPILYKVALAKAEDMARRGYFDHVDPDGRGINILLHQAGYTLEAKWIEKPSENYFESLGVNYPDARKSVFELIKDAGVNPPFHRYHLLGHEDFYKTCPDGAIAFVRAQGAPYKTYMVVIIAKQKW